MDAASRLATGWDVPLISAGHHGHINSGSDLGLWPTGQGLLAQLPGRPLAQAHFPTHSRVADGNLTASSPSVGSRTPQERIKP